MEVVRARNVNDAFAQGLRLLASGGRWQSSRAGAVLVYPTPVVTEYSNPLERVLFHVGRNANPFFHLMEALWMLAGRNDATWLDRFVSDFSLRFAENDGSLHGAYGFRWRHYFSFDQLQTIIKLLRQDPADRRIVLQMWDCWSDLGTDKRDIPCNTHIYFRMNYKDLGPLILDMTVCCRSNDIIWGAYGANAVHFSILQEYVAAMLGVGVGTYYQVSNNYHAYVSVFSKIAQEPDLDAYQNLVVPTPIVSLPEYFNQDLDHFFSAGWEYLSYRNAFFPSVAVPMRLVYRHWRDGARQQAIELLRTAWSTTLPKQLDWLTAGMAWMIRHKDKAHHAKS